MFSVFSQQLQQLKLLNASPFISRHSSLLHSSFTEALECIAAYQLTLFTALLKLLNASLFIS
ncbi:hypothetical protein EYF80_043836 [Liparis tanakae]|uniref:Uncharacterized protein n=1 Tax=Liparis tanakae TaxID=230148 RepID=A0A4Z2FYM2_9TELE|nr:hypothetical protein EYF80_043836 [Liparis tanakae]